MIVYNVTVNVDDAVHAEWLQWMKSKHIPDVMATGMFTDYSILRLLSRQEDETGVTYAIQFHCRDLDTYERYQREFAPALQADTLRLYEGKFAAFRTLLEVV